MTSDILIKKVRYKIRILAIKGYGYTSLDSVPFGTALKKAAQKEGLILHERYLFGSLRFVTLSPAPGIEAL